MKPFAWILLALTFLLPSTPAGAAPIVIDTFSYGSARSASDAWRAIGNSPPVEIVSGGIAIRCPFSKDVDRVYWDRTVALDLRRHTSLVVDLTCNEPTALRGFAVYLRSGDGWYVWNKPLREPGRQRLQLAKSQFSTEGKPAGWDKIDRIRISPWRGSPIDTRIVLHGLQARQDGLVIVPATMSTADAGERAMSKRLAERIAKWLTAAGISHTILSEEEVAKGALKNARFAILPLNPNPPPQLVNALDSFAGNGGKMMVCFSASEDLARIMHVRLGAYQGSEEPGHWSGMQFYDAAAWRIPGTVYQSSWNIRAVQPADASGRVIARWFTARGEPLKDPAWVATDRGLWFTHVLLEDDTFRKHDLLVGLLGRYDNTVWYEVAQAARSSAGKIDAFASYEASRNGIAVLSKQSRDAQRVGVLLERAAGSRAAMDEAFAAQQFADVVSHASALDSALIEAYSLCQASRPREMRAIWDHDGVGWYIGDWPRTARELRDAGINTLFLNLQWAGLAHYESSVLPESNTKRLYGDQMAASIAAARANGLSHHVWKICWNLEQAPDDFKARMKKEGRVLRSDDGRLLNWLDPSDPRNVDLELAALKEIARKYPTDGIHLDYIRFPPGARFDGNKAQAINRFVELAHRELKAIRPDLQFSAAVWGAYPSCVTSVGQDWATWLKAGWVDFVCPMNYTVDLYEFNALLQKQLALPNAKGRIYPGIGVTAGESQLRADHVIEQILSARRTGVGGFVLYDLSPTLRDETLPMLKLGLTAP